MNGPAQAAIVGTCDWCGKRSYPSRKTARKAAHDMHPDGRLNAYPCPLRPDNVERVFHLGHLPQRVVTGRIGRDQVRVASRRTP